MQMNVSAFIFFTDISSIISAFEKYTASQNQPSQDMQVYSGTHEVLPRQRVLSVLLRSTYMRIGKNPDT